MNEIEKLKQELSDMTARFNERIDALAKKQTFEVGKWYKSKNKNKKTLFVLKSFKISDLGEFDKTDGYGFNHLGEWIDSGFSLYGSEPSIFEPASDEEVFEALKKEAERRGFKEGVIFMCITSGAIREFKAYSEKKHGTGYVTSFELCDNGLWCKGGLWTKDIRNKYCCSNPWIFKDGEWAEILPSKKKMTIKEIESELGYEIEIIN